MLGVIGTGHPDFRDWLVAYEKNFVMRGAGGVRQEEQEEYQEWKFLLEGSGCGLILAEGEVEGED